MLNQNIPAPLVGPPVQVTQRILRTVGCPNPGCDHSLDITDINAGTMIECQSCKNVTWVPVYREQWWQKAKVVIGGLILSFVIGFAGSLAATYYWEYGFAEMEAEVKVAQ